MDYRLGVTGSPERGGLTAETSPTSFPSPIPFISIFGLAGHKECRVPDLLVMAEQLGEAAQAPECSRFDGSKRNAQVHGGL